MRTLIQDVLYCRGQCFAARICIDLLTVVSYVGPLNMNWKWIRCVIL